MLEKIELNCVNCGAPLGRRAVKCEYCGTEYKRSDEGIPIGIDAGISGTKTICAEVKMDHGLLARHPEEARKFAEDKLAHAIAKELLKFVEITTRDDHCSFAQIMRARVEVVPPRMGISELETENKMKMSELQQEELRRRIMRSMLMRE